MSDHDYAIPAEKLEFFEVVYTVRLFQVIIALELQNQHMDFSVLSMSMRKLYFVCFDELLIDLLQRWDELPVSRFGSPYQTRLRKCILDRVGQLSGWARRYFEE